MVTNDGRPRLYTVSNENHVRDINFAVKHAQSLLTIIGVWPYVVSKPSRISMYASKFLLPVPCVFMLVLLIPVISDIILREMPRYQFMQQLGPLCFRSCNLLKWIILLSRRDSLRYCMRHMEADWRSLDNEKDRQIMMRNLRMGHGFTLICIASTYSSAVFYYMVMPMLKARALNAFDNGTVRPLVFPGVDIYVDLEAGHNFEIMYCNNCVAAFFMYTIVITIVSVGAILVSHACGQIQIVISRLEGIVDSHRQVEDRFVDDRIDFVVRCHVRVLRFASGVDEVLREMCFVDIVGSTFVICLVEYYCLAEWDNSSTFSVIVYMMMLVSFSFNIFIFCHIGELLKEQCLQVGRAAYMTDWYRLPGYVGPTLVLIIAMANYPRKLTAGKMMELSYMSFGAIMKTSFMYLGMLKSMTE